MFSFYIFIVFNSRILISFFIVKFYLGIDILYLWEIIGILLFNSSDMASFSYLNIFIIADSKDLPTKFRIWHTTLPTLGYFLLAVFFHVLISYFFACLVIFLLKTWYTRQYIETILYLELSTITSQAFVVASFFYCHISYCYLLLRTSSILSSF